ncbi:MAG: hypothetical protein ABL974_04780 [Prosthecobacter sp.]
MTPRDAAMPVVIIQKHAKAAARAGLIFAWSFLALLTWLIPTLWTGTKHGYIQVFPERWKFVSVIPGTVS